MSIKLRVSQPCHEDWNKMTPGEQGRFCAACAKTVVDFSMMSDREVLTYFSKPAGESVCGRFMQQQLERRIDILKPQRYSWRYVWNVLVATLLITVDAKAQSKLPAPQQVTMQKKTIVQSENIIPGDTVVTPLPVKPVLYTGEQLTGTILNKETQAPVVGASVMIKGSAYAVTTDKEGRFTVGITSLRSKRRVKLRIRSLEYEDKDIVIRPGKNRHEIIYMEPYFFVSGGVQVVD